MGQPRSSEAPEANDELQSPELEAPTPRPPGRIRAAWSVLRGQAVVPAQVTYEWLEYKLIFDDILKRLGAQLARAAKAEHQKIRKALEPNTPASPPVPGAPRDKSELRRRAAALRGLGPLLREPPTQNGGDEP